MARIMYVECFAGAAGDMLLGALIDAGLPVEAVRDALGSLQVGHRLEISRVVRAGIAATKVDVVPDDGETRGSAHGTTHADVQADQTAPADVHAGDTTRAAVPVDKTSRASVPVDAMTHTHVHADGTVHTHAHPHHGHSHGGGQGHAAEAGDHGHRTLKEIARLIGQSSLSPSAKAKALALFERIGHAEAAIHGTTIDEVHLHEVGAVDSIIDIVGVVFGMDWFGVDEIVASPMNVGGGTVEIAHGTYPVPAPATMRLLVGVPTYSRGPKRELVTPTGAVLVSGFAKSFGPAPAMTVERVGYGAGSRDFAGFPNVVRVSVGETVSLSQPAGLAASVAAHGTGPGDHAGVDAGTEWITQIECEIDDMNPQLFGSASERLFALGAVDVFLTPVQMKKGRPGTLITVLAPDAARAAVCDALFRETSTIGVRFARMQRETLERRWVTVDLPGGAVRVKLSGRGGEVFTATPEFDDCTRVAAATGRPVKEIQREALRLLQL